MSSDRPWMKFYPRDWRGDQALRAVSLAARGFWMECLCIMHEAKPYGHLLLNSEPVGDAVLARMTGTSVDEASALMAELRQAGVLSMTRGGVITSRRMIKDEAASKKGLKAVGKRWSQATENEQQNTRPNRLPSTSPITHMPEAIFQKEREEIKDAYAPSISSSRALDEIGLEEDDGGGFAAFWNIWPERAGPNSRMLAESAFDAAVVSGVSPVVLIEAAKRYRDGAISRGEVGTRWVKAASNWLALNVRGWEDRKPACGTSPGIGAGVPAVHEAPKRGKRSRFAEEWEAKYGASVEAE